VLTVEKVRVEFPVRVNNDVMEDAVRVLTNNVEKSPSYPFSVEYAFSVETLMVHAVNVLSSIVENVPLLPFNAAMVMGVLTTIVENTTLLPFREDTFAVEAVRVLSCIVDNRASFPEIFTVERWFVERWFVLTVEKVRVELPVIEEKSPLFAERSLVETRNDESVFVLTVEKVRVELPVIEEKSPLFAERSLVETRKVERWLVLTVEKVRLDTPTILENDASLTFNVEIFTVEKLLVFPTSVENVIFDALMDERVPTLVTRKNVVLVVLPIRLEKVVLMLEMLSPFMLE
jgi:hypothetical protein